jgi:uncharacterized protein (DUF1684 family)
VSTPELELTDWRRRVGALYAEVRAQSDPEQAHALWRAGRDDLFRTHPQSPLAPDHPIRETGISYWPYDPALRFELEVKPAETDQTVGLNTGQDGTTTLVPAGRVELPAPLNGSIVLWWLHQYAGGLFAPLRDGSAGDTSYGGGRYLLDTAKGADLGGGDDTLIIDLNFLYHPSCRYDPAWVCPLAPAGNRIEASVLAGERL